MTTQPTIFARPVSTGFCDCNVTTRSQVRSCSRSAAFILRGRRYCTQHLPATLRVTTGEAGDYRTVEYVVVKKG